MIWLLIIWTPSPQSCRKFFSYHLRGKSTAWIKSDGTKNFHQRVLLSGEPSKFHWRLARRFFPTTAILYKEPLGLPTHSKIFPATLNRREPPRLVQSSAEKFFRASRADIQSPKSCSVAAKFFLQAPWFPIKFSWPPPRMTFHKPSLNEDCL